MKLHGTDVTMVCNSHLHAFVITEVEHTVTLCGKFSDRPFCKVIDDRIAAIFGKGKDPVPELVQIMKGFRQVR